MRNRDAAFFAAFLSVLLLGLGVSSAIPNQSQTSPVVLPSNHVSAQLLMQINSTQAYIRMVNQSAYFIFYPNLAQSYKYLDEANSIAPVNQSKAVELLALARSSAHDSLVSIDRYRLVSLIALIAITLVSSIGMYMFMRVRPKTRHGKRTSGVVKE